MSRTCPEDRAADPHMCGTMGNRGFKIRTHAHAQSGQTVAAGNGCQHLEMRHRVLARWRDTHQTRNTKAKFIPAQRDERVRFIWMGSGLLRFFTCVDLKEEVRVTALGQDLPGKNAGKLWAIDRMDRIKERHGIPRLVRLKWTDEVDLCVRKSFFQGRPFLLGFLNTVLTKHLLSGSQDRRNGLWRKSLAHRHQRHIISAPAGGNSCPINLYTDSFKSIMAFAGRWSAHGC